MHVNRRVLVVGGCGYIGSHTITALLGRGYIPVVFDNFSSGFIEAIPAGVNCITGDIRNYDQILSALRGDNFWGVIHFAARINVSESVSDPIGYYDTNLLGTFNLLRACAVQGVKNFVFSSTAAVYGNYDLDLIAETVLPAPTSPYGRSKLACEFAITDVAAAHGMSVVILRYFNVAGAALDCSNGQRTKNASHLIKVLCEVVNGKREYLSVFGRDYETIDGSGVRDFIHIADLADLHVDALDYCPKVRSAEVFNCGYGVGYSVLQVVNEFESITGKKINRKIEGRRSGDVASVIADSRKIRSAFRWTPKCNSIRTICESALAWERKFNG